MSFTGGWPPRHFLVAAGAVMADQTGRCLRAEIKTGIHPAVTDVTGGAGAKVAGGRRAVVVDDVLLAQALLVNRVDHLPGQCLVRWICSAASV